MRKSSLSAWALSAFLLGGCLTPVVWAAEGGGSSGGGLLQECPTFKENSAPCDEFIANHYGTRSSLIIATLNSIDRHKDQARQQSTHKKYYDRIIQGTLIILAFLTTALAAVARTYRDERFKYRNVIGLLPILASALVTMMAGFSAYYKFEAAHAQHTAVAKDLAKLQSEINYELIQLVGNQAAETLDFDQIETWYTRLDGVLARYREPDDVSRLVEGLSRVTDGGGYEDAKHGVPEREASSAASAAGS